MLELSATKDKSGKIIKSTDDVNIGDDIFVRVVDGEIVANVETSKKITSDSI